MNIKKLWSKMDKIRFYSISVIFLSTLFIQGCDFNPAEKLLEEQSLINSVRKRTARRIEMKYKLNPIGTGAKALNKVKMLALAFESDRKIDIEEGRKLLVNVIEIFLEEINKDEKLRPYLANYPFNAGNVEIRIFMEPMNSKDLIIVKAKEGEFSYKIRASEFEHQTVYSETYDEAVEKLRLEISAE